MAQVSQPKEIYRFIIQPADTGQQNNPSDSRSRSLLADAHSLGFDSINSIECHDLYFIEGQLIDNALQRLVSEVLSDPITQTAVWGRLPFLSKVEINHDEKSDLQSLKNSGSGNDMAFKNAFENLSSNRDGAAVLVEVGLRPGVTDAVADQILHAARELEIEVVNRASTGFRYWIRGDNLSDEIIDRLIQRLLVNPTIQRYALGEIEPVFPLEAEASGEVAYLPVRLMDDDELLFLSGQRLAALDLAEMQAVRAFFLQEGRDPSDVEFETIAQTWSEHCVHKTFKAFITFQDDEKSFDGDSIDSLIKTYLQAATEKIAAPWVRSAFVDNAGIIDFDDEYEISFKVETHNHPSAIEPFGGANTGVGGVIRDILGVSARPIANTDVLCFGSQEIDFNQLPEGILHPRRIRSGVVAGIEDYGNKMGIPTVNGSIWYDPGFIANPLVYCGCVGIAPKDKHPRQPRPGDHVIVIGGRTGRDGLRGATFSSMTMDAQTGVVSGASVQIGNPITEKSVMEVVLRLRDASLYNAITDCGAGGLSSAVGEMASEIGVEVDLTNVRLKYPGLAPWEIWLSEAQERMVLAVSDEGLDALSDLCTLFDVEWSDLGVFTSSGRLVVRHHGKKVLDLENNFLHHGIPQRRYLASRPVPTLSYPENLAGSYKNEKPSSLASMKKNGKEIVSWNELLLKLLAHPNIASKSDVIRRYDHEVQGGTIVKPLTGLHDNGPSDGCVLKPMMTQGYRGFVLANGINPYYGKLDTYRMAWCVIDEALRNAVAVGADPTKIALLDNFCWGDPRRPETLGALVEAVRGCYDAAIFYQAPFISGKDSLNNEYLGKDGQRHAIPPTLLISSIGIIEDIGHAVTMDLKSPGDIIYLLGDFQPVFGGSHLVEILPSSEFLTLPGNQDPSIFQVPDKSFKAPAIFSALHGAMQEKLIKACHDLSEGGLAIAIAEMCIGGMLGVQLDLSDEESLGGIFSGFKYPCRVLFGETNGCLLVEVSRESASEFETRMFGLPLVRIGQVTAQPFLKALQGDIELLNLPVNSLVSASETSIGCNP